MTDAHDTTDSDSTDTAGDRMQVDISATDDAAEQLEDIGDAADDATQQAQPQSPSERGREEAKRYLSEHDGDAETALQSLRQEATHTQQQLQQARQQVEEKQERRETLAETKARVEGHPPERPIMQTLGGGITLDVPHQAEVAAARQQDEYDDQWDDVYHHGDLLRDIEETRDQLAAHIETLEDHIAQLETALETAEATAGELDAYKEMQAAAGPSGAGGDPPADDPHGVAERSTHTDPSGLDRPDGYGMQ